MAPWRGAADLHGGAVVPAGSAIIFCEATTHGTTPWVNTGGRSRKTLFYKYSPPAISWSSDFFDPEEFAALYPDLPEEALLRLEPPNARYGDRARSQRGPNYNRVHDPTPPLSAAAKL
eukprot:COSAG01_NODE_12008_length_1817_cov_1.417928_2_plen_118_part_00